MSSIHHKNLIPTWRWPAQMKRSNHITEGACCLQGQGSDTQPDSLKPILQAAHAGTAPFLQAQQELTASQPRQAHSQQASGACDLAALATITKIAQPLIADIVLQSDMTHVQRAAALRQAKASTVARLVKMGIFRNQV